jgi:tRNA (cmo5U34)-methyltransferase
MMNKRFQGKTGKEFDLSAIAIPHRQEMQELIGAIIQKEFKDTSINQIKVLEIGFGTGFTTKIIARSDNRIKVFAIDNEIMMLKQAESNLAPLIQYDKVKLIHEDALEFLEKQDSNSFDVFASCETIHNFEHEYRQKILKEIYRILKTDGFLINADKYALDDEHKHKESLTWQLQEFQNKLAPLDRQDLIKEWTQHYLDDDKPERIMKESKSIELMKSLGFKDINIIFRKQMEAILIARK